MSKPMILFASVALISSSATLAAPFTDAKNGYSLDAPQGWQKLTVPGAATAYTDGKKGYTMSVVVQPAPKVLKLEGAVKTAFMDAAFGSLKAAALKGGATTVIRTDTTLGGQPALGAQYTLKDGNTYQMILTAVNEKAYILILTAAKADFAKQQALYGMVKTSFKINK